MDFRLSIVTIYVHTILKIKHFEMKQISALNNPLEVDMPLKQIN